MSKQSYDREYHAQKKAERNEIGAIPAVEDPDLRARCLDSLETFLIEMFEDKFPCPFGDVQKSSIQHEERMHREGAGRLNKLEPRGYGKTTRFVLGSLWSILAGHRKFILVCAASLGKAEDLIEIMSDVVTYNKKLMSAFPELYPFHLLEGNPHRGSYQTLEGEKTGIAVKSTEIIFPKLPGAKCSGAKFIAVPFMKARGQLKKGERPDLVGLDDIQSTEDAESVTTVDKLMKILYSDIAFLGSRRKQVAIINNATIINAEDFPDRLTRNRAFVTVRYKMVESMPNESAMTHWDIYREIREHYDDNKPGDDVRAKQDALKYYEDHRDEMDAGASVTWDYAFSPDSYQISTLQAAMDFIADYGMDSFLSECQNEPRLSDGEAQPLRPEEIQRQVVGVQKGMIPEECDIITAAIDISEKVLWWNIVAWSRRDFTGHIVKYGVYPDQKSRHITLSTVRRTIRQRHPGDFRSALIKALDETIDSIASTVYLTESGEELNVNLIGIDSGWGEYSAEVYRYVRRSKYRSILRAMKGVGITAKRNPLVDPTIKPKSKESIEAQWKMTKTKVGIPLVLFDTNFWKARIAAGFRIDVGTPGAITVHKAEDHRMLEEQLCSERPDRVSANGRTIDEYSLIPGRDNHLYDCTSMAGVLGHIAGARFQSRKVKVRPRQRRTETKPADDLPVKSKSPRPSKRGRRAKVTF